MEKKSRRIERKSILNDTLAKMDDEFTSNEFSRMAEFNGITREEILNGVVAEYLRPRCNRLGSNRKWGKKSIKKIEFKTNDPDIRNIKSDEEIINEAVELLKLNGYKVLKPVSEWVEL